MCHICGHSFADQKNMDAHVKNHSKSDESKANILNSIDNALNKQSVGESSQAESGDIPQEEEQSEDNPQNVSENVSLPTEEQPGETPQEEPGRNPEKETAETPQGTQSQPNLFSEEYIDTLVELNPDFAEESQHSEESLNSTDD